MKKIIKIIKGKTMKKKFVATLTAFMFLLSQTSIAQITVDGNTATTVVSGGANVSNVYTDTSSGKTGFNSFTDFNVDAGKTVNMYLNNQDSSKKYDNLVNMITGSGKTNIDGILNSYRNGKIGGNVFFLNPNGIAIGKNGVVNVGALTLATPAVEFVAGVLSKLGSGGTLAEQAVLAGDIPINNSGTISIKGKINAYYGVDVAAGNVEVGDGTANSGIINTIGSVDAAQLVNLDGSPSTEIVNKGGRIVIQAKNIDVKNNAKISSTEHIIAANNKVAAGDVIIAASDISNNVMATSKATVNIGAAEIKGNDVSITAVAKNTANKDDNAFDYDLNDTDDLIDLGLNTMTELIDTISEATGGVMDASVAKSDVEASITIADNAKITAENDVNIKTAAESDVTVKSEAENIALSVGINLVKSNIEIGKAAITAGHDANIEAYSYIKNDIEAKSVSEDASVQGAVGVSVVNSDTSVSIAQGASVTAGNNVYINAMTEKDITVTTGVEKSTNTKFGLGVAVDYANMGNKVEMLGNATAKKNVAINSNVFDTPETAGKIINEGGEVIIGTTGSSIKGNNISVTGKDITVNDGSSLITAVDGSNPRGDIEILASDNGKSLVNTKSASVTIGDADIKGNNVTIEAKASNTYDYDKVDGRDKIKVGSLTDTLINAGQKILDILDDVTDNAVQGVIAKSDVTAKVNIKDGAEIEADNDLKIASSVVSKTELKTNAKGLGVGVAVNLSEAAVNIGNAVLKAGNDVNISAASNVSSSLEAKAASYDIGGVVEVGGSVGVSVLDSKTLVDISEGSDISANNDINVSAYTEKDLSMTVETKASENASAGLAVGVNISDSENAVKVKGKMKAGNDIDIDSAIVSKNNKQTVSSSTGNKSEEGGGGTPEPAEEEPTEYEGTSFNTDKLQDKTDEKSADTNQNSGMENDSNGNKISIAGSVLYSDHSNTATAEVSGSSAELEAGGDINITASVIDANIKQFVDAAVSGSSGTAVSGTGAVVIADYTNNVNALVDGASIDAGKNINVKSNFEMPFGGLDWFSVFADFFTDPDFDSGKAVFETLKGGTDGLKEAVVNSWVRSSTAKSNADPKESEPAPSPEPNPEDPPGGDVSGKTGSSFSVDVSGAVNLTDYNYSSQAVIKNAKVNQKDDSAEVNPVLRTGEQAVNVEANSKTTSVTVGGVFGESYKSPMGQSGSDVGVGGTYNQVRYKTQTNAVIEGNTDLYANDLNINANNDQLDVTVGIAGGESSSFGLQGVFNWVKADNNVNAGIFKEENNSNKSNIVIADGNIADAGIKIAANDTPIIVNVAGSLSKSEQAAVGVSAAVTDIDRKTNAAIENAVVNTVKKASLNALNDGLIHSYAVAAAVATKKPPTVKEPSQQQTSNPDSSNMADKSTGTSGGTGDSGGFGLGISGSAGVSNITGEANAYVKDTYYTGEEDLDIKAGEESDIINGAGGVSIVANGGSTGVGVAGAGSISWISNNAKAYIEDSTVNNDGNINIIAESDAQIVSVAAGLSGSTSSNGVAVAGSGTVNITDNTTDAYIKNSKVTAGKDVNIEATDESTIYSIAGAAGATAGAVGFGAAVGVNVLNNNTASYILNSDIFSGGLIDLDAANKSDILAIAGAVGIAAGTVGLAVTVIVNVINNSTKAYIEGKKLTGIEAVNASMNAKDGSNIFGVAGVAGIGNTAGIGIGAGVNVLGNEALAYIKDSALEIEETVNVKALVESEIDLAIAALGGAGTVGIAGSAAVGTVANKAHAYIDNSTVEAKGSVGVFAENKNKINLYSGAVGIGGTVGIGGNIGLNLISNEAISEVRNNSRITSKGNAAWSPTGESVDNLYGLIVKTNMQDIVSVFNFAAGGGGTVGVSAGVTGAVINNYSRAEILNSEVNMNINDAGYFAGQGVYVNADNETDVASYGGQLAVAGTAGVAAVADFLVMGNSVTAGISKSTVKAKGDVEVKTNNVEKYGAKIVAGAIGGSAGVAANVAAAISNTENNAYISESVIEAGNNVNVKAKDTIIVGYDRPNFITEAIFGKAPEDVSDSQSYFGVTLGAVAGGLYAGVSGAAFVSVLSNSVKANITDSKVTAANKLSVDAESHQQMNSTTAVGGFGAAGVAISGTVNIVNTATEALIKETSGKTTEVKAKDIEVKASNEMTVNKNFVGLAGGVVGVTAGIAVSVLNNNVLAGIGAGVKADASNDVSVTAANTRKISEFVASMAGGGVGVNGAVSVNVIGSNVTPNSDTEDSENINNYLDADFKKTMADSLNRGSDYNDENVGRGGLIDLSATSKLNVGDDFNAAFSADPQNVGTQAYIGSGAQVTAGNDISINATDTTSINNVVGQMASGGVSVNASVGIADVTTSAKAYVDKNAVLSANKNINIVSDSQIKDSSFDIYMGAIGGLAVVNAAVSVFNFTNDSLAYIAEGANVKKAKDVNITAKSSSNFENEIYNAAIASGFAAGAVVAVINKDGNTSAYTGNNVKIGDNGVDSVNIKANTDNKITAATVSAAGGIGAASVNVFSVSVADKLSAYTGTGNIFNLNNALSVLTNGKSNINASYKGLVIGGFAVAASVADLDITINNKAYTGENNRIKSKDVSVTAKQSANTVSDIAGVAGGLLSGTGMAALSDIAGSVVATVKRGSEINSSNNVLVSAVSSVDQRNSVISAVAGLIALGISVIDSNTNLRTAAELQDGITVNAGTLDMKTDSDINMLSSAQMGSIAYASASGAPINTTNTSVSEVVMGKTGNAKNTINVNNFNIYALGRSAMNSFLYSRTAALYGLSVFRANNTSNSYVIADISGNTDVNAVNVDVKAKNEFAKNNGGKSNIDTWSVTGASLYTAETITAINNDTNISFGQNTNIATQKDSEKNSSFMVDAYNKVYAEDDARFEAVAAGSVAHVKSEIENNSDANVIFNGKISAAKDINVSARSDQDIKTNAYMNVYSLLSGLKGESINTSNINNNIILNNGADIYTKGDVYFNLSQDNWGGRANFYVSSIADIFNKAIIPIDANSKANANMNVNDLMLVNTGANVRSAGNISVLASKGIVKAAGFLSVYTPYGETATKESNRQFNINKYSDVEVNGGLLAGVNNIQQITIGEDRSVSSLQEIEDPEITHESIANNIIKEIEDLEALVAAYSANTDNDKVIAGAYKAEIERLKEELRSLGLTETVDGVELILKSTNVDYITFDDIYANRGDIMINADNLYGSGTLSAPGYAEVSIINNSDLFLRLNEVGISDTATGEILFNRASVKNNADINALNTSKNAALSISAAGSGEDAPKIVIKNTYTKDNKAPYIELVGDMANKDGSIEIISTGNIISKGNISASELSLNSDKDIVQSFYNGYYHVGGDPSGLVGSSSAGSAIGEVGKTGTTSMHANNIFLSARYLNLNGIVQAGTSDWYITIFDSPLSLKGGFSAESALAYYLEQKAMGKNTSELFDLVGNYDGNIKAKYNVLTGNIELADVSVEGGNLEIYGHILSSGYGELRALNGYGKVNITNNSGYDLLVNNIYNDSAVSGRIKITDVAKTGYGGEFLQTIYTYKDGNIAVWSNTGNKNGTTSYVNGSNTTSYNPLTGQRYVWTTGITSGKETKYKYENNVFWGMDWIAPDESDCEVIYSYNTGERNLPGGEYLTYGDGSGTYKRTKYGAYHTDSEETWSREWKETHGWWIFSVQQYNREWIIEDTYKTYYTNSIKADYPIKISFFGNGTPETNITANQNVLLNGNIMSTAGNVNVTSKNGYIESVGSNNIISAKNIKLSAKEGIGTDISAIGIRLAGGNLKANTGKGYININSRSNININEIVNLDGDVKLFAEEDITAMSASAKVKGKNIDLTSNNGKIEGNGGSALNIDTDTINAAAEGDISFIKTASGDLGVVKIESEKGDVSIVVEKGSVTDANLNDERDERKEEELLALWDSLDLFNESGADWSRDQLLYAMNTSKQKMTSTQTVIEEANIIGNNVYVKASGSIGTDEGSFTFNINDVSGLTNDQKIALAAAEYDNIIMSEDENEITILKQEDFDIYARNGITLDANGYVYLGGEDDLNIDRIDSGSNIIVKGSKGIYNVSVTDKPNISGNNVVLEAGDGNIGAADKLFILNITGNLTARTPGNIYLSSLNNLALNYLTAGGNVTIETDKDVLNAHNYGEGEANITAQNITVKARNIGSSTRNLNFDMWNDSDTIIEMIASGSMYINNVYDSVSFDRKWSFSNLKAGEYAVIGSKNGDILKNDSDSLISAKNIVLNAANGAIGTADEKINVLASDSISASAKNDIYLTSDGSAVFEGVKSSEGLVDLFSAGKLYADEISAKGKVNIIAEDDFTAGMKGIESIEDFVNISAKGNMTVDGNINAAKNINIIAGKAYTQNGKLNSTGGKISIDADSEVEVNGTIDSYDDVEIAGKETIYTTDDITSAAGKIELTAYGKILTDGNLNAKNDVVFNSGDEVIVSGNVISAAGNIDINSALKTDINGTLTAFNNIGINVAGKALTVNGETRALNGNIDLNIAASDLFVNNKIVAEKGIIYADAYGSIIDDASSLIAGVYANEVDLLSRTGDIGSKLNYFRIDNEAAAPVTVTAVAENGGVYIDGFTNGAKIKLIKCAEDIVLMADGNIEGVFMGEKVANLVAKNITMHSLNGSIGTEENRIIVAPLFMKGKVNLSAAAGMYLDQYVHIFYSDYVKNTKNGKVSLLLPDSHAAITEVSVSGKTDVNIEFLSNKHVKEVSLTYNDIKKLVVHPTAVLHPSLKQVPQHKLDLLEDVEDNISVDGDLFASSK